MEAKDKIIRAKVHLQTSSPFFAYLVMNLNIKEENEIQSIGVDGFGNMVYNSKWIDKLADDELKAVLSHEVLHLALEHFIRGQNKEHEVYNIAGDLVINDILVNNNFKLPKGLVPYNHEFEFNPKFKIVDLDKKCADEVYNEIMKQADKKIIKMGIGLRFDKHIYGKVKGLGGGNDKKIKENQKKWNRIFSEASVYCKQQGKLPMGIERLVDLVLNEKVNWKSLLYKYITRELPFDYSYSKPSKRSVATGIFMPSVLRENINIVIAVDTSGSIGQKELSEFLSEIVNISKSFNNINMKLIVCDSEIKDVYDIKNGNIETIMNLQIRGGGGTSFIVPLDYVKENLPNTKFVVFFTDGYGNRINYGDYPFKLIWLISPNGTDSLIKDSGEVIKLE